LFVEELPRRDTYVAAIGGAIWSTDFSGIPLQREAHTKRLIEAVRSPAAS
jgi:hypothetical protein